MIYHSMMKDQLSIKTTELGSISEFGLLSSPHIWITLYYNYFYFYLSRKLDSQTIEINVYLFQKFSTYFSSSIFTYA